MKSKSVVLVTGASGFIGSHLTKRLIADGRTVVAIDCFLDTLYSSEVKKKRWRELRELDQSNLHLLELDLRVDELSILKDFSISSVMNLAALPGIMSDWGRAAIYYECNLMALNRLVEFCRSLNLTSFVQASTSSVYGKIAIGDEEVKLRPTSPYGVSKLAAENLLLAYREWFGIPAKILRYFSVYGPHQRPDMAYSRIIEAVSTDQIFELYGDGEQKRSNTYIDDIIDATLLAEGAQISGEVLNICGDEVVSLNHAIETIESIMEKKLNIGKSSVRSGDQKETSGVNSKAKNLLGWKSKVNFSTGIEAQIKARLSV